MHRIGGQSRSICLLCVDRCLPCTRPSEYRHWLMLRGPVLCGNRSSGFAQTVSGAFIGKPSFAGPFLHPVAKAVGPEGLAEIRYQVGVQA